MTKMTKIHHEHCNIIQNITKKTKMTKLRAQIQEKTGGTIDHSNAL